MLRGNILVPGHLSLLQGIELGSPALQADSLPAEPPGKPYEADSDPKSSWQMTETPQHLSVSVQT